MSYLSQNITLVLHPPTDTPANLPSLPHFSTTVQPIYHSLCHPFHQPDQMIGHIDKGERQMSCVMHQITVPTPGTVQDNSTQTPQVDTDVTATSSNVVEMQDENVRSPHSELKSREVTPICREPPVVNQGVELLTTESGDNGGQDDQGEAANIMEVTVVAGEAEPIIREEGGISSEHHQMMEENSRECPTEGEGGTTILVLSYIHK
ncbi:hypothetical protein F5141DRAFT_1065114 [Pisolithus sp. B1]|nr:hypothetical protein F5141DRAFT_1065114 [Pisolithus sp. B1]